mgnify:CR=1 FL=1
MLVTSLPNIRYLTGFSGSNAALFISAHDPADDVIATDGRYTEQVAEQCPDLPMLIDRATLAHLADSIARHGVRELAIEGSMSLDEQAVLTTHIPRPVWLDGLVESLRVQKDAEELRLLADACAITAQAMSALFDEIGPGWTEIAVARRLEQRFGELGAQDRAFPTIVGAGAHAAIPHHEPTTRELTAGDLVVVDAGARVGGYHADMTRTVVVGTPAAWQVDLHREVAEAAARGRAAALVDASLPEVDAAARGHLESVGLGEAFVHGLGHGVGLEIHEAPMIGPRAVGRLAPSTPITIEPGAYLAGRGGVRIEDTLVVGSGAVLTDADRSLRSVG